ncbi:MAG: response regulator transcription factor [Solirubrobacterales bacterium]
MANLKILLVEDELKMAEALSELLRLENYIVDIHNDGISAMNSIYSKEYHMIILDVMLPGMSGFEIARNTRKAGIKTPILMLTSKNDIDDKVTGLDSGGDDYLTKPFEIKELLARLRALGRRYDKFNEDILYFGDIALNKNTFQLTSSLSGQSIQLSKKEYQIMELFLQNQNQVLTREQLVLKIWGYNCDAEYNNVEVYLSFTRRKLAFIGSKVEIKALRGIGYELRDLSV